jgi:Ca-activated chloride channel family protein
MVNLLEPFLEPLPAAGVALLTACLVWWSERRHARRIQRGCALAFGSSASLRGWLAALPTARGMATALFVWGILMLLSLDGGKIQTPPTRIRHLMLLLDVSPSMLIADAGPNRDQSRALRAADVLLSALNRAPGNHLKISVTAFYTHAKPLVHNAEDRNLVMFMAQQLPLHIAFKSGKTNLVKSVNEAAALCSELPRDSTTLLVLSDGDTLSDTGLLPMPPSISRVIIAGVGDTSKGAFIDSHISRQDSASLGQLARRLKGFYYDCNLQHIPSAALTTLLEQTPGKTGFPWNLRLMALTSVTLGAILLALLPWMVQRFGAPRHPALRFADSSEPVLPAFTTRVS